MKILKIILAVMFAWLLVMTYMALTAEAMTIQYGNWNTMQSKCRGALGCFNYQTEEIYVWKSGNAEMENQIETHEVGHYLIRNMSEPELRYFFWSPTSYKKNLYEMREDGADFYVQYKKGKADFIINNLFKRLK